MGGNGKRCEHGELGFCEECQPDATPFAWTSEPPSPGWYWTRFVSQNLNGDKTFYQRALPREFDGDKILGNGAELYPAGVYINLHVEFWPVRLEEPVE